jgi:LysR family cyn operon transcriptional activator
MELRQLKYFLKAKELLNFTEAAEQLNISQSTLSQQIKQLEDELDIPLFNRIGKRVTLTEAGALFADFAFKVSIRHKMDC